MDFQKKKYFNEKLEVNQIRRAPFTIKDQKSKFVFSDSIVPIRAWHLARLRSSANFSTRFVSEKLNRFKLCLGTRPDVSKCLGIGSSSSGALKNRPTQMIPKLSGQIFRIISQLIIWKNLGLIKFLPSRGLFSEK